MATRIKIKNLAKGKKTTHKELKRRGEKPRGEPIDASGVAGGKDWSNTLESLPSKTTGDF